MENWNEKDFTKEQLKVLHEYRAKTFSRHFRTRARLAKIYGRLFLATTLFSVVAANLYRLFYYFEYDLDIANPRISTYHTKRMS